jgi:hypothetical protein
MSWDRIDRDTNGRSAWMYILGKGDLEAPVPVHAVLADYLTGFGDQREGWLFPGRFGDHVNPNTIWSWVREVSLDAGIDPVHTHLLRHTFLTEANDVTGELRTVQEIARHSRPETTAGYTRVRRSRMASVISQVTYGRTSDSTAAPHPADGLPGPTFRQVVETIEGPRSLEAWAAPGQLLAAATALANGVALSGAIRLGPWIEQPFFEFVHGDRPTSSTRSQPQGASSQWRTARPGAV